MERIGPQIEQTLAASGDGTLPGLREITAAWPAAVGEAVSRQAWPLRLASDGALHVATTSATWAFELDRLAPEIGERLAELLGSAAPSSLRFRVGPVPEPGGPLPASETPEQPTPPPSPGTASAAATIAAGIEDPDLRERVEKAARGSLERARSDRGF